MLSPPHIMIVIGGYNSSNTNHLANLCAQYTKTYHIEDAVCIDTDTGVIRHKKIMLDEILTDDIWLPDGKIEIGLTAGASTPDSKIGETVERVLQSAGYDPSEAFD